MAPYFPKQEPGVGREKKIELLEYILIDLQRHLVTVIKEKLVLLDLLLISWTDSGGERSALHRGTTPTFTPPETAFIHKKSFRATRDKRCQVSAKDRQAAPSTQRYH